MKHLGGWLVRAMLEFFGGDWPAKKTSSEILESIPKSIPLDDKARQKT